MLFAKWDELFGYPLNTGCFQNLNQTETLFPGLNWNEENCTYVWNYMNTEELLSSAGFCTAVNNCISGGIVSSIVTLDTSSIDHSGNGTIGAPLQSVVKISPNAGNSLVINSNGLFVPTFIDTNTFLTSIVTTGVPGVYNFVMNTGPAVSGDFSALVNKPDDTVINTVSGHLIATHTSTGGVAVNINETITALGTPYLTSNVLYIPYTNEDGVVQTVNIDLQYLITNNVYIEGAEYDAGTNVLTLTDGLGNEFTIDLSEFSIIATTLPNGDIEVTQEGVVKFVVPRAFRYSLSNGTVIGTTIGNRATASAGSGADKVWETSQMIDPATGHTINMTFSEGGTVLFDDTDINFVNGSTLNYDATIVTQHNGDTTNFNDGSTVNISGSEINSTNNQWVSTGDVFDISGGIMNLYDTVVNNGVFNNNILNTPTINNAVFTGTISLPDGVIKPRHLAPSVTDEKIVVREDADTRRNATPSDIEALGFVVGAGSNGSYIDLEETFIAYENITAGEHVAKAIQTVSVSDDSDVIKSYTVSDDGNPPQIVVPVNYGQAFNLPVDSPISTIIPRIRISTASESGGLDQRINYSFQLKIYAITGTYGSTAIDTGSPLLTSTNTVSGFVQFATIMQNPTFVFDGITVLPAGNYAYKLEGSISSQNGVGNSNGILRIYGDNTGAYSGNAIDNTTAVPGSDTSFILKSPLLNTSVYRSAANNLERIYYVGQAMETVTAGSNVKVMIRGTIGQIGSNYGTVYYLGNSLGTISTSIGVNAVIVGNGIGTGLVSLRGLMDLSQTVTEGTFSLSGVGSERISYTVGGGILNLNLNHISGGGTFVSTEVQISKDRFSWITIGKNHNVNLASSYNNSFTIPKDTFIRIYHTADVGSASSNINYFGFLSA